MPDHKTIQIRDKAESQLCSGLYLVPTPIGNLRDMTLRALDILVACDVILCEDSRVTGKLLKAYDIPTKKKIVYNDHADDQTKAYILDLLNGGDKIIALVSDAGTPLISDPGYKLVRDCLKNNIYVTALPGANAVLPALQLSGLPTDKFMFCGFIPSKEKAARDVIALYKNASETLVFYDTPSRIEKTLTIMGDVYGGRSISISREISKLYEESLRGNANELIDHIKATPLKGELVVVVEGCLPEQTSEDDLETMILDGLNQGMSVKDLSANLAQKSGWKKKDIYDRAIAIRKK